MMKETIDVAVITGGKAHDVINFHKLFHSLQGINCYIQHIDDFASTPEKIRDLYDVVLFFFMMLAGPTDDGLPGYCGQPKTAIEHLVQTGQGIVILHHALLAYPQWPIWSEIVGIADRELSSYQHDETLQICISDEAHPITRGLSDWNMVDETYLMANAADDNKILLTVKHERSMETVAWTRQYMTNKVFCLQLGHDHQAWKNNNFKEVLRRGIEWSSNRH